MSGWERIAHLDRRWVFLGVALAVVIPVVTRSTVPLGKIGPPTRMLYDYIEAIEPGEPVMIAFDYGPSSMPELHPQAQAIVRHCMSRKLRVITVTLTPQGTALARDVLASIGEELGAVDGEDYVNLGYRVGALAVIAGMGESIRGVYSQSADGDLTDSLPVMDGVDSYDDIPLMLDLASGNAPMTWITFAGERYDQDIAAGVTAVVATEVRPYLQSDQLVGLVNGLKGAAEYEELTGVTGDGATGMAAQSVAHLLIIALVLLGNIAYFVLKRRRGA